MTFVSPWLAGIAAAVAVPTLLLLYFLKLRRRYVRIPSTLLWQRAVVDLQVNTPFQRLRASWLLLLQMLMLVLLLLALAQPRIQAEGRSAERYILLMDVSASMSARAREEHTRLDEAKERAKELIARGSRGMKKPAMMVIAVGATPRILCSWQTNAGILNETIEHLEATDEEANLQSALQLAGSFTGRGEKADEQPPEVVFFSDGSVAPPVNDSSYKLSSGTFTFVRISGEEIAAIENDGNIGIAGISARRDGDEPSRVQVLGRVVSSFSEAKDVALILMVNGEQPVVQIVRVPASKGDSPGEASAVFTLTLSGESSALVTLHQNTADALESDDTAGIVVPPVFRPRIALVQSSQKESPPDPILPEILRSTEPSSLTVMAEDAFTEIDVGDVDSGVRFDLIVFDQVSPTRLPAVPTLTFGGIPPGVDVATRVAESSPDKATNGEQSAGIVLTWDRTNPALRNVSLDSLRYTGFTAYEQSPALIPLANGPRGTVMAAVRARGATHVFVGFALAKSNWRLDISLLMLIQNVLDDLPGKAMADSGLAARPGEPVTLRAAANAGRIRLSKQGVNLDFAAQRGSMATIRAPSRVGVLSVSGAAEPVDSLPVSVLSAVESDLRPRSTLLVNAEAATATPVSAVAPVELWPMLAGVAVVLLVIEWLVYTRQVGVR